jgi:hypothetical protein
MPSYNNDLFSIQTYKQISEMHLKYLALVLRAASSMGGLVARSSHDEVANRLADPRDVDDEDYVRPFESPEDEAAFHAERAAIERMWDAEAPFGTTAAADENNNGSDFMMAAQHGFGFQKLSRYTIPLVCTVGTPCTPAYTGLLARRDSCNNNPCDSGVVMRGEFAPKNTVCNKDFTACKTNGDRWQLKILKTNDRYSCKGIERIVADGVPQNSFYGTLHDRGKNMKRVGHCYADRGKADGKRCDAFNQILADKRVYCVWN